MTENRCGNCLASVHRCELCQTRQALNAANALIGVAADEAKELQDRITALENELVEWRDVGHRVIGLVCHSGEVTVDSAASDDWNALQRRIEALSKEPPGMYFTEAAPAPDCEEET
jgi:hypothetical protein